MDEIKENKEFGKQIDELNKTISRLAFSVVSKTKEIDNLEKQYSEKLIIVNKYIKELHDLLEIDLDKDYVEESDLIDTIENKNNSIQHISDKFMLVPKKLIKIKQNNRVNGRKAIIQKESNTIINQNIPNEGKLKYNKKKKLTCSYCLQKGHKRAECPKIIYNEN